MPKFAFIGEEQETRGFGLVFPRGVAVEVSDPHAVLKLSRNQFYAQVFDGVEVQGEDPPKRRGRPPKDR
jgi:hypothetical protein